MMDAQQVLHQVWQQSPRADWKVLHGKRADPVAVGCMAVLIALFFIATLGAGPLVVLRLFPERWLVVSLGALVLALLIGIGIGVLVGRDRKDPDPLLVILPEGFVEYISWRKPIVAIAFAELADLTMTLFEERGKTITTTASANGTLTIKNTSSRARLDLVYRDGRKDQWEQRSTFEAPELVPQTITTTYAQYVANSRQDV